MKYNVIGIINQIVYNENIILKGVNILKKIFIILMSLFTLTFFACSNTLSDNEEAAKKDIADRGYTIIESKGEI